MNNEYYIQRLVEEYEEFFMTEENNITLSKKDREYLLKELEQIFSNYNYVNKNLYAKGGMYLKLDKNINKECDIYILNTNEYKVRIIIEEKVANRYFVNNQIYITLQVFGDTINDNFLKLVYSKTR